MVHVIQINDWINVPCFSHTLNLAVEKVLLLPEVSKAVARCHHLVSHFHHSSKSSYFVESKTRRLTLSHSQPY